MKNILKLILIFATLNVAAQNPNTPSDFVNGIKLSEATQVTTTEKIPIIDTDLLINSWISSEDLLDGLVSGSGTVNYLSKFTAVGTIGDSQVFDNGTNVGIGTTNPLANLNINGQASEIKTGFKGALLLSGSNPNANYDLANKIVISSSTGYTSSLYTGGIHITRRHPQQSYSQYGAGIRAIGDSSSLYGNSLELYTSTLDNPNVTGIKITEDSTIGIGTDNPTAKTEVLTTDPSLDYFKISSSEATKGDVMTVHGSTGDVEIGNSLEVTGSFRDSNSSEGLLGRVLTSTVTGTEWSEGGLFYGRNSYSTTQQLLITLNTLQPIISEIETVNNGFVADVTNTEFEATIAGVYRLEAIPQFINGGGDSKIEQCWQIDTGGGFVTDPQSVIEDTFKKDTEGVISCVTSLSLNVGDKVRAMWASDNNNTEINTLITVTGNTAPSVQHFITFIGK